VAASGSTAEGDANGEADEDLGLSLVRQRLDDDLDTPGALGALDDQAASGRPVVRGAALLGVTL
jgi:hypothetical protein